MIPRKTKVRIGDMLVSNGEITEEQLQAALAEQRVSGRKLGRILVDKNFIDEDRFLGFLSEQFGIPFVDLKHVNFEPGLVGRLPETYARRYRAIVLEEKNGELLLGMADPMDVFAYDELARQLKQPVALAVVRESELLVDARPRVSPHRRHRQHRRRTRRRTLRRSVFAVGIGTSEEGASSPVARLLQSIMEDAVQVRASDVHIEPDETVLRIRQRVDGVLQETTIKETRIAAALVSRLKLIAGLDISEKRLPQDGRFETRVKGRDIDVRLSTMPVQHGESVVMRLLDQSGGIARLEAIGMPDEHHGAVALPDRRAPTV